MRAGCRRILKWIGIGFFIFFCMIPLGIAVFQEATGIVILPTTEPLPTSVALAEPSETPVPTDTDVPTATITETLGPTATSTETPLPTETPTPTMTATATLTSTITETPTLTATATETMTLTPDPLVQRLLSVDGVENVLTTSVRMSEGLPLVYLEIIVSNGYRTTETAQSLLQTTSAVLGTGFYEGFSAIIDDGQIAEDYIFDFDDDEWRITPLESFNATREAETGSAQSPDTEIRNIAAQTMYSEGSVNVRSCPQTTCDQMDSLIDGEAIIITGEANGDVFRGSAKWYRLDNGWYVHSELVSSDPPNIPDVNYNSLGSSSGSSSSSSFTCPRNCDGAVAMGLSPQQAASCPGLDRDHDGVACYGD